MKATFVYPWENILSLTMAKARACLQAVIFANELGSRELCVEGDDLTVIKKLRSAEEDRSNISNLIREIKSRASNF